MLLYSNLIPLAVALHSIIWIKIYLITPSVDSYIDSKDYPGIHKVCPEVSSHVIWKIETFIEEDMGYKKHCT